VSAAVRRTAPHAGPRLRADLEIVPEDRAGVAPRYVVRDPRADRVFVLAEESYFLCASLDGRTPTAAIAARYAERFGTPLAVEDVDAFVRQLASDGLLDVPPARLTFPERLDGPPPHFDVRLGHLDPLVAVLERRTRWLFTRPGKLAIAATIGLAVAVLATSWSAYTRAASQATIVRGIAPFLFYLVIGNVVRLAAQGTMLKRYGLQLLDVDLTFAYYVVPALAPNSTSAMLIREKYERMRCILAGVWAQILVWALAMIAWRLTTAGGTANALFLATSVGMFGGTLLLSVNPLLQTDGYFVLSLWLETTRLRTRGLRAFGDWLYRRPGREAAPARDRRWLTAYGALCALYYVGVRVAVVWIVGATFARNGAGAMAAVVVGAVMFEPPLASYAGDVRPLRAVRGWVSRLPRWGRRLGLALLVVLVALIPYPYEIGGSMVLLPQHRTEVTAEIEGLVARVLVAEGQHVDAGEAVAEISPWEYQVQLESTQQQLISKQAELELMRLGAKPEAIARATLGVRKAEEELASVRQQVQALTVRLGYTSSRYSRYKDLYAQDAVSRQDYENALKERDMAREQLDVARSQEQVSVTALEVARADLESVTSGPREEQIRGLEAEVERLRIIIRGFEEQLRLTTLRSSVAGRVSTPHVQQKAGHFLHKGEVFAVIEESSTIQAEVQVPEEDAGEIRPDARVKVVTWTYPDRSFLGRVLFVAPVAASATGDVQWHVIRVLTELPNDDGLLMGAMTGYAKIAAPSRPVWKVFLWPPLRWLFVQAWYWLP
jgi:putative peptide zinc metalloprotease protein